MAAAARLELDDIQGLVARGYSALRSACFLLLTVDDPVAARSALGRLALMATNGSAEPPESALNLAFTSDGLRRLGLDTRELEGFSHEFVSGMTDPNRSRLLGDVGENAPSRWRWGGPGSPPVDVIALLYARDAGSLGRLESHVSQDALAGGGLAEAVRLGTSRLTDREPFGFRDGISQPLVEGLSKAAAGDDAVKAGSSSSATPTNTDCSPTGRCYPPHATPSACCPARRTAAGPPTSDAMEAIWCSGSSVRTSRASTGTSKRRRDTPTEPPIPKPARRSRHA
ncbi:hypothetical protein [Streptomyces cirratus]|uniref:hypothetical protein n=1 Tax=Streptomyces cirratus TaxID=68187 RepID=UPI00362088BD